MRRIKSAPGEYSLRPPASPPDRSPDSRSAIGRPSADDLRARLSEVCRLTERELLRRWARAPTTPVRAAFRSRLVLAVLDGRGWHDAAVTHATRPATVRLWVQRVALEGVHTVWRDAPGRGRKPTLDARVADAIVLLRSARPAGAGAMPSLRTLARQFGVSPSTVRRVLQRRAPAD